MPFPTRPLATAALLAGVVVGGCTCFEQKRTGPLPTAVPIEETGPAPRSRYEPTPLDPPPPAIVESVPAVALPERPAEPPTDAPLAVKQPEETTIGQRAHAPRIERLGSAPLSTKKALENLRKISPAQRSNLLRGPLVFPKKLQPLAPAKAPVDPDAPQPEPLPID